MKLPSRAFWTKLTSLQSLTYQHEPSQKRLNFFVSQQLNFPRGNWEFLIKMLAPNCAIWENNWKLTDSARKQHSGKKNSNPIPKINYFSAFKFVCVQAPLSKHLTLFLNECEIQCPVWKKLYNRIKENITRKKAHPIRIIK